jgi:hypothetical protein
MNDSLEVEVKRKALHREAASDERVTAKSTVIKGRGGKFEVWSR